MADHLKIRLGPGSAWILYKRNIYEKDLVFMNELNEKKKIRIFFYFTL